MPPKDNSNDNRDKGRKELDSSDFDSIIRDQMGDDVESDDSTKAPDPRQDGSRIVDKKEPEVITEDDKGADKTGDKKEEDPLQRALSTIASLQQDIDVLKKGTSSREAAETGKARDREPSIEFEEVIPRVRLPKDKTKWPIQLVEKDLEALGLEPSAAPGLNVLANALYAFVLDTIPDMAFRQFTQHTSQALEKRKDEDSFFGMYPDLKGNEDLLAMVETDDFFQSNRTLPKKQYMERLADAATDRIAKIRGMSKDEYVDSVRKETPSRTSRPTTSRAITSSGSSGSRGGRPSNLTSQEKEMQDLL